MERQVLYPWETATADAPQAQDSPLPKHHAHPHVETQEPEAPQPKAPTYLLVHVFQPGKVTLLWGGVEDVDGYLVLRGESPKSPKPVAAVDEPNYIDSVSPGKTYFYTVRAYNEHGQSLSAPLASVTLPEQPEQQTTPPEPAAKTTSAPLPSAGKRFRVQKRTELKLHTAADAPPSSKNPAPPASLHAAPQGTHCIALHWDAQQTPETEFRVFRSTAPWNGYGLIAETKDCQYLDAVPEAGTKYYYFVQAAVGGHAGQACPMVQAIAFPPLPQPETPVQLRAIPRGSDAVELRWSHTRGAAAYAVYARAETDEEFQVVGHSLDHSYLHTGLAPEQLVEYRVQAYHDSAASELSAVCGARTTQQRGTASRAPLSRFPAFPLQGLGFRNG